MQRVLCPLRQSQVADVAEFLPCIGAECASFRWMNSPSDEFARCTMLDNKMVAAQFREPIENPPVVKKKAGRK